MKCSQTIHIIKSFLLSSVHRNDVQQNITTNGRHEEQRVNSYCFRGMINLLDIWTIFLKETVDTVLKNLLAFILPEDYRVFGVGKSPFGRLVNYCQQNQSHEQELGQTTFL